MKTKNKTIIFLLIILLLGVYFYKALPLVIGWGHDSNYKNVTIRTTVNVTDAMPEILNISCNSGQAITLVAGSTKEVSCLVSIMDFNGGDTIAGSNGSNVNATFYYYLNQPNDLNDNNTHYTNATCSVNGTPNGFYVNWTCTFQILYYANNGTWKVNATVFDTHGWVFNSKSNFSVSAERNSTINALYALNVTPVIDYGQQAVGDTSDPVQANITNYGNMNINISVYGFGNDSDTVNNRLLAMTCEQRNITISNERYSLNSSILYNNMISLNGTSAPAVLIQNLTIVQQTNDSQQSINSTYWVLHVNATTNPYGQCNGTVVFSAQVG